MQAKDNGVDVRLHLYSLAVSAGETQTQRQELQAQLFQKGTAVYIRYEEVLEGIGPVSTTIKVEETQVTIIRHGAVRMKHSYRLGEKTTSLYQTPHGTLEIEADTTVLEFKPLDISSLTGSSTQPASGGGVPVAQLILSYRLSLQEQDMGQFTLELRIQEQKR